MGALEFGGRALQCTDLLLDMRKVLLELLLEVLLKMLHKAMWLSRHEALCAAVHATPSELRYAGQIRDSCHAYKQQAHRSLL